MEYTVAGGAETQQNQPSSIQSAVPTSLYPSYVYDPQYALYYHQSQIPNPNIQQQYDANGSLVHPPGVDLNQAVAYANASTYLDSQQLAYYYAAYPQAVVSGQDPNAAYYQDPNAAYYQNPNAAHLAYNPYSINGAVMQPAVAQRSANPNSAFRAKRSMGVRNTIPMKKRPKIPKVVQSAWCEVCKVDCNSKEVLDKHNLGKKHKKNVEKIIAASRPAPPPPPPSPPPPPPPQVPIPSASATTTITGPQENPKKGNKSTGSKRGKRKAVNKEDLETKKKKMLEEGASVEAVRWCEVCNVVCNSETVFRYHLAGKNHAFMEKRHANKMKRLALKTTNNSTASTAATTGALTIAEPAISETVTLTTNAEPAIATNN